MARLSKATRGEVENLLADLETARDFILDRRIAICIRGIANVADRPVAGVYRGDLIPLATNHGGVGDQCFLDGVKTLVEIEGKNWPELIRLEQAIGRAHRLLGKSH